MSSYSDFTSSGGFGAHHEPSNKADPSESEVQRDGRDKEKTRWMERRTEGMKDWGREAQTSLSTPPAFKEVVPAPIRDQAWTEAAEPASTVR